MMRFWAWTARPYRSVVSVALGYRAKDDDYAREAKVRFPAGEVIDIRA